MKSYFNFFSNPSSKIIFIVFTSVLFISGYFIIYNNYNFLENAEKNSLKRLKAISNTIALQIDGNQLAYLSNKYKTQGEIINNEQDSVYLNVHTIIKNAYNANRLKSSINTLFLDHQSKKLYYIVNSTDTPYIRLPFINYPKEFISHYKYGAVINKYTDEYGTWISAFSPVLTSKGIVSGIVEVDESFDSFLDEAKKNMRRNILISSILFVITIIFLLRYIKIILKSESASRKLIEISNNIITQRNKEINDSIEYARQIQTTIMRPIEEIEKEINCKILFIPKDIVSGDFYWSNIFNGGIIIAACDCTGHGVPGSLMSMINSELLNQKIKTATSVGNLLTLVNNSLHKKLDDFKRNDGMDICVINLIKDNLYFAGANRPLYIKRRDNTEIEEIKSDKMPIGGNTAIDYEFNTHVIKVNKGDKIFLTTDGFQDQFGGVRDKKFSIKRLRSLFLSEEISKEMLLKEHLKWKGLEEQTDDILIIILDI